MHVNTTSCFLAVKYAAPAMMKTKTEEKEDPSGSIIVSFSLTCDAAFTYRIQLTASVAGLRSGAGPVHCEFFS